MKRWMGTMLALWLLGSSALADTPQALRAQAARWQEMIVAYGREIVIDVTPQVPDVQAVGLYRAEQVEAESYLGEGVYHPTPTKRRGIAYRAKPDEVFALEAIEADYHAYGNPLSAGEALAAVQAFLAPVQATTGGVELAITRMTGSSPKYIYNKNTGEWGELLHAGEVGTYSFDCAFSLDGVPIQPSEHSQWQDWQSAAVDLPRVNLPYWQAYLRVQAADVRQLNISAPVVTDVLEADVALAPLEATKASLRALAQRGLLRDIMSMQLAYMAFDTGVEGVWTLQPVWITEAEIYFDETRDAAFYGEKRMYAVITDARTGQIVGDRWADGAMPKGEAAESP